MTRDKPGMGVAGFSPPGNTPECGPATVRQPRLYTRDGSDNVILRLGEIEGSHVDIEGTGFRLIREDGEVELVEVGGSGGRVIARATTDQAR